MSLTPFREVRLPTDLSFGSRFGPSFRTEVVVLGDGSEQRNSKWGQSRHTGDVHYSVKTVAQLQVLLAFFHARRGQAQGFRFKWHLDYQAVQQPFGVTDGVTTVFQLQRRYAMSGSDNAYFQRIRKPVGIGYPIGNTYDSVTLFTSGVPIVGGYALDYTTGLVTFGAPPVGGQVLAWDGEFDWPVRFDVDALAESLQLVRSLTAAGGAVSGAVGVPTYGALQDANAVTWYVWADFLGQLQRDTSPPVGDWVPLTLGTPPRWHQVLDETSASWWLYPDVLGQLQADDGSPGGTGLTFTTQPLDGITFLGANGLTSYRLGCDSNQQAVLIPIVTVPPPTERQVFDGVGMTEPLPIIELRS